MMTLEKPDITGNTTQQQVEQIINYLHELVEFLQVQQQSSGSNSTQS